METQRIVGTEALGWDAPELADVNREALSPMLLGRRQIYLDAFELPVAVVALDGGPVATIACNPAFHAIAGDDLSIVPDVEALVGAFLRSGDDKRKLCWRQVGVGGRAFRITMSRLEASGVYARRALVSMVDHTAEVEAQQTLRAEMLRDGLTGLPNRAAFVEAVEEALAGDGEQASFALLAVDLVRFSRVNEGVGALAGDELILTVAHRLRAVLAPADILARTAGDEFGVLVRLVDGPGDALHTARRIRDSLAQPIRLSDLEINIDCSIGCAIWGERTVSAGDLMGNTQVAMKRAKASGRIEVYKPGEVLMARRRFSLETDLRRAIERDQLALAFQPLLDLETNAVTGFEALARWTHADHGTISPAEFIPVAEESGLIVPLGRWALYRAARTLAEWDAAAGHALPIRLSVNVSAVQLARDSLVDAVACSGIAPERLTLELTESAIVADPDRTRRIFDALHDRQCNIAMDDFGTGYSCLATLQRLSIDVLKIDRSLVTDMHGSRDSMAIVRAVLGLARALNMSTTAEGIERADTASMLGALGCTTGQGYYFARPLCPADALAYFLSREA